MLRCAISWQKLHRGHINQSALTGECGCHCQTIASIPHGRNLADEPSDKKSARRKQRKKTHPEPVVPISIQYFRGNKPSLHAALRLLRPFFGCLFYCSNLCEIGARRELFCLDDCPLCAILTKNLSHTHTHSGGTKPWVTFWHRTRRRRPLLLLGGTTKPFVFERELRALAAFALNFNWPPLVFNFIFPPNRAQRPSL